tara:strand:- start:100 stop:597 length:498 start_codon:yes stop_codon:yes gene_type:complete
MSDFNDYVPGQAYAKLKDEIAQEFTLGQPKLPTGTTTYKSGAKSTTTETPYGYHIEMRGPKRAARPPTVTTREKFTDMMSPFFQMTYEQYDDDDLAAFLDALKSSSDESFFYEMPDMTQESPPNEEELPFRSSAELMQAFSNPPILVDDEYENETIPRSERIEGL